MLRAVPLAFLVACSLPAETDSFSLVLSQNESCSVQDFSAIEVLSVELLGDDGQSLCALAKRCVFAVDDPQESSDLAELLRRARAPLIDVEAASASTVAVLGHSQSCWQTDDLVVSGFASLADAAGGELGLQLDCPGTFAAPEIPFCP